MEVGAKYNKQQLHGKKYFTGLLETVEPELCAPAACGMRAEA
jgi:hypothetical protein